MTATKKEPPRQRSNTRRTGVSLTLSSGTLDAIDALQAHLTKGGEVVSRSQIIDETLSAVLTRYGWKR